MGSILAGLGTLLNLFFSAAMHKMLSREAVTFTLVPLWECISGLFTEQRQGMLFLSFECFVILCCVLFFVQNSRSYQSDLMKVTDDIEIPVPVGQYQHGSSRWLKEEEKEKVFEAYNLDPSNPVIKELIATGYDGLDFINNADHADTGDVGEQEYRELSDIPVPIHEETTRETKQKEKMTRPEEEGFEMVEYEYHRDSTEQETKEIQDETAVPEDLSVQTKTQKKELSGGPDPYRLIKEGGIVIGMEKCGKK